MIAVLMLLQAAMPSSTMATRVESLLSRSPIPREGEVAVLTTSSADTVYVGDQLEILTTAWFPSAVRDRLRRPPTLRPPSLNGVWSLPVVTLPGVAAHRDVGETSYDLYASHQVVFPVSPGRLVIPMAELAFSSPSGRQFFGDERREERRSAERTVVVLPLPASRRPSGFAGPVGRGLQVSWRIATPNARVGELLPVDVMVRGEGNLTLWGPPQLDWPAGVRVYPDQVSEFPGWRGPRLAGVRQFRYLLLPDSAGSITLPAIEYPHFDPLQRTYRVATADPVLIPILPSIAPLEHRDPPTLLPEGGTSWSRRLVDRWSGLLVTGAVLAPILALLGVRYRRQRHGREKPQPAQALTRFELVLGRLLGGVGEREPAIIAAELRRAGVDQEESDRAVRLHEGIRALRYARPSARAGSEQELAEESARWLARLPSRLLRRALGTMVVVIGLAGFGVADGQELSPQALFREGAWGAAAMAQSRQLAGDPTSAASWYNLGAMRWMAHDDAAAAAAWLEALRLAPRVPAIRRGWTEVALRYQQVRGLEPSIPAAPEELLLAGLLLWVVAAGLVAWSWPRRRSAAVVAGIAVVLVGSGLALRAARGRAEGFTVATVPLRAAPHGLADPLATVDGITLVRLEGRDGAWVRVREPRGQSGWLLATSIAVVRGLD